MGKSDKGPEKVTRSVESGIPAPPGIGPSIYTTTIHNRDGSTTTGKGATREEADKNAGDKASRGKKD